MSKSPKIVDAKTKKKYTPPEVKDGPTGPVNLTDEEFKAAIKASHYPWEEIIKAVKSGKGYKLAATAKRSTITVKLQNLNEVEMTKTGKPFAKILRDAKTKQFVIVPADYQK